MHGEIHHVHCSQRPPSILLKVQQIQLESNQCYSPHSRHTVQMSHAHVSSHGFFLHLPGHTFFGFFVPCGESMLVVKRSEDTHTHTHTHKLFTVSSINAYKYFLWRVFKLEYYVGGNKCMSNVLQLIVYIMSRRGQ